jgi:hypothetical protein
MYGPTLILKLKTIPKYLGHDSYSTSTFLASDLCGTCEWPVMAEAVRRFLRWSVHGPCLAWSWPSLVCSTDHDEPVKDFNPSGEMIDRQSARHPGASDRVRGCNEMNWPVLD